MAPPPPPPPPSMFQSFKKRKRTPRILTTTTNTNTAATATSAVSPQPTTEPNLRGAFRENIREFLQQYCDPITEEDNDQSTKRNDKKRTMWFSLFLDEPNGVVFPLYIIEEVQDSPHRLCELCRCVGWSNHFVSRRNYHLIIPEDSKRKVYPNKARFSDLNLLSSTHLLHGLIHCNGYGHLLTINGFQSKSLNTFLYGEELMNLWDHLCSILRTGAISVYDQSGHISMDLRLLHGVTYGRSWFSRWGYEFYSESYGLTEQKYNRAIEIVNSLELNQVIDDYSNTSEGDRIEQLIRTYRYATETRLTTVGDLLQFVLHSKYKFPVQGKTTLTLASMSSKSSTTTAQVVKSSTTAQVVKIPLTKPPCHQSSLDSDRQDKISFDRISAVGEKLDGRWPRRRFEYVVRLIVNILQGRGTSMLRQDLRDAVREHIGDTGLIDFVLKNINEAKMGNLIVRRKSNPKSRLLEFSLDCVDRAAPIEGKSKFVDERAVLNVVTNEYVNNEEVPKEEKKENNVELDSDVQSLELKTNVDEDIFLLYKNVLMGYGDNHLVGKARNAILESKHFVKEWHYNDNHQDKLLSLVCRVKPSYTELTRSLIRGSPPGELVVVPRRITVGELKLAVQSALRDTYCEMEKFIVEEIKVGDQLLWTREDQDLVLLMSVVDHQQQGCVVEVWVRGCGLVLGAKWKDHGVVDDWMVDCVCGAKDDDGERMMRCDDCHVWVHTRCSGIENGEAIPSVFKCTRCASSVDN